MPNGRRPAEVNGDKRNPHFMTVGQELQGQSDQVSMSLDDASALCYIYSLYDNDR
jgi:hypothetical protein